MKNLLKQTALTLSIYLDLLTAGLVIHRKTAVCADMTKKCP